MLFPLMMALLFVAPLLGYYWLWSRHDTPLQSVPAVGTVIAVVQIVIGGCGFVSIMFYSPYLLWVLCLIWGILSTISLGRYLHFARQAPPQKLKETSLRKRIQILVIGLLVFIQLAPIVGYTVWTSYCFAESHDETVLLIQALTAYHEANQQYPRSFSYLVPDYIDYIPSRACEIPPELCYKTWHDDIEFVFSMSRDTIDSYVAAWFFASNFYDCITPLY